jgi:capsular exopolysaccharide synthesis family protein
LRDYLSILWTHKWTISLIAATATGAALFFSYRQVPLYSSSAEVIIRAASFNPNAPSGPFGFVRVDTEVRIANSASVADIARRELAASGVSPADVSATQIEATDTLRFTSVSSDPAAARASTQAYAEAYLEFRRSTFLTALEATRRPYDERIQEINNELKQLVRELESTTDQARIQLLTTQYTGLLAEKNGLIQGRNNLLSPEALEVGEVLRPANLPSSPSSPDHVRAGQIGIVVGLLLGIAVAYARDRLDEPVRGREELEFHSGAPVLAFIPRASLRDGSPVVLAQPMSQAAEAYKTFRTRLLHAAARGGFRTLLITSSVAGEGKTATAANLGIALAHVGKRVIILSADVRRPGLQNYFPVGDGTGLAEVLIGRCKALDVLATTGVDNLSVLHVGGDDLSSSTPELLGSEAMKHLLADLRGLADFVLVDSPPLLAVSDSGVLAPMTDGVLFVADARRANRSAIEQARYELQLLGAPIIGVVLNNFDPRRFRTYGSGYRYSYDQGNGQPLHRGLPPDRRESGQRPPQVETAH